MRKQQGCLCFSKHVTVTRPLGHQKDLQLWAKSPPHPGAPRSQDRLRPLRIPHWGEAERGLNPGSLPSCPGCPENHRGHQHWEGGLLATVCIVWENMEMGLLKFLSTACAGETELHSAGVCTSQRLRVSSLQGDR